MTGPARMKLDTELDQIDSEIELLIGKYSFNGIGDDDYPFSRESIDIRRRISELQDRRRDLVVALMRK